MINNFTKEWLTSTLAPDSIINIKSGNNYYLDCIKNENNTKQICILSNNDKVIAIGKDY